jgi:hypothetical protein
MEILSPKRFSQLSSEEQKIFHLLHLPTAPKTNRKRANS